MEPSEVTFPSGQPDAPRSAHEFAKQLSELGARIWNAIQRDDQINELLFELADAKLELDRVNLEDSRLDPDAAEAIMGMDSEPEMRQEQRSSVPASEWLKYSLFNFALDWVLDQALMRMKIQQKWPFQEEDGLMKPPHVP